jgi:hypothetical protein
VKKTNNENLLAGSTEEAQAGTASAPSMKHGEESPAMLLALLNSPLETMINSQQAKILGTALTNHGQSTIIIFYNTVPTANSVLQSVGTVSENAK